MIGRRNIWQRRTAAEPPDVEFVAIGPGRQVSLQPELKRQQRFERLPVSARRPGS
jgi:hypothetical protein